MSAAATPPSRSDLYYDPYDYAIDADPHPVWRRMRDEAPLYRNDKYDFFALSRFEDVMRASLDDTTFSSAHGTVLELIGDDEIDAPMMIFRDRPEHTRLRKLVSRAFSPRQISKLEPEIRRIATGYLDALVGQKKFDFLQDFGAKLPVMVISTLLGVPEKDREDIRRWTDMMLHREEGETQWDEEHNQAGAKLWGYFGQYVADRRKHPQDDIITALMQGEITGADGAPRHLTDNELLAFIGLISAAGNETVARLLGWTAVLFARHPGERAKLVAKPAKIPNAVEELLRFEAPSPVQARWVSRAVEYHGVVLERGSKVLLLTGSAGRDEREYPDPDRFQVDREFERHVSLGFGTHFCLGASLARLESRIAIEETLKRFPEWDVVWDEADWVHTSTVRGYASVPITV